MMTALIQSIYNMKKIIVTLFMILGICLNGYSQMVSMNFPKAIISSGDPGKPTLKLKGDSLFVCCTDGIYCKDLAADSEWEPYAFNYGVHDVTIETIEGISETATEHSLVTVIHDLQGRRLQHASAKGVYIQDGKKQVVK